MERNIENTKCQMIYENLLVSLDNSKSGVTGSAFVRELFETSRCDNFSDFAPIRTSLTTKINEGDPTRFDRIMKFEQTTKDEEFVAQACYHYNKWHSNSLMSALSWPNWIRYNTIDRCERTVALMGIFGGGYAGLQVVRSSYEHIKNMKKQVYIV